MKDERLVSKMEGKTNFSRRLKLVEVKIWLTLTAYFTTDLRHCQVQQKWTRFRTQVFAPRIENLRTIRQLTSKCCLCRR